MKLLRRVLALTVALAALALGVGLVSFYSHYLPLIRHMPQEIRATTRAAGAPYTPLGQVPSSFANALLATEDRRFYRHHGFDARGFLRAMYTNVRQDRMAEGGSTITQQLARGQFLTRQKSVQRKLREILLALAIERTFAKDEILEFYINQSYFGHGAVGIGSASQTYFGKAPRQLRLAESAFLAGVLRGPSLYDAFSDADLAKRRQGEVLRNMVDVGYLTAYEAEETYGQAIPNLGPGRDLGLK